MCASCPFFVVCPCWEGLRPYVVVIIADSASGRSIARLSVSGDMCLGCCALIDRTMHPVVCSEGAAR